MQKVEFFRWWVTAPGRKREYLTSFEMDAATAQLRYPGARPDPTTRIERVLPETEEERLRAQFNYQSAGHDSVKPPRN